MRKNILVAGFVIIVVLLIKQTFSGVFLKVGLTLLLIPLSSVPMFFAACGLIYKLEQI